MAVSEELISFWENILSDLKTEAGKAEQTRIVPNLEVIDAAPAAPLTNYIIVAGGPGGSFNGPALKLPGYTYTNGDLVNVLFVEGTEPIAMQQGSGSSGSNGGKVSEVWESDFGAVALQADADGKIGIGTSTPGSILHTVGDATNAPIWTNYGYGSTPTVLGLQTNGTEATPTATADGNNIWLWAGYGYETTTPAARLAAEIRFVADTPSGSNIPGGVVIRTHDSSLSAGITSEKFHMYPNGSTVFTADVNANAFGTPMTNSSGAAVIAGDIGYMDEAGDFQTTTTPNFFTENMLAVTRGGANGAEIYVTKTGELTLNFVSGAPSAGDYLVTSNTAGKVTALLDVSGNTYMSPEVVAVAVAAGSGSTVQARLLLNTTALDVDQTVTLFQTLAGTAPPSDFSATIATLPTASSLTYTPTGGNENALDTAASTDSAKMILHNTTRGTSATMSGVVVGTNTINFVTAYPASSQVGDTITLRSQTNTTNLSTAYWVDLDLQATVSPLARSLVMEMFFLDTGAAGSRAGCHPYEANAGGKRQLFQNSSTAVGHRITGMAVKIINGKICILWQSNGTTSNFLLSLRGVKLAAP